MPVRMKDIAADLGVSIVTVSKAINNHMDISEATRQRVLRRMQELNYEPNLRARGLLSGKSFILGFIVPDLVHAFFSEIAESLATTIKEKGYSLLISSSNDRKEIEAQEIRRMLQHGVDGLLLASCQEFPEELLAIRENRTPLLLIDRTFTGSDVPFIGADDELIGHMATEHLIQLGCRKIAHIGGGKVSTAAGRLAGYRRALRDHKIRLIPDLVINLEHTDQAADTAGADAMRQLLRHSVRPDAVFCHNDPSAIGAMRAILEAGLRIPEDVALIGSGNIRYSESLRVPLSTIAVSTKELGRRAGSAAFKLIESGKVAPSTLLKPVLIVRDSTCKRTK